MYDKDKTTGISSVSNLFSILKGYYLDGSQVAPIVRIARCPECKEPFFVKTKPILNSRLLTTLFSFSLAYDVVDEHLELEHNKSLNVHRGRFIRKSTFSCLTNMYGRADA